MSYNTFIKKINALIAQAGGEIEVRFSFDKEKLRYFANCSDGTIIIGKPSGNVEVLWGKGERGYNHKSVAAI